jgi:hypothetical protein
MLAVGCDQGLASFPSVSSDPAVAALRAALGARPGAPLAEFAYEPFAHAKIAPARRAAAGHAGERFEAGLVFGRHADRVGQLKALVHFRDGQDAGSAPVAVATRKKRASAPTSSSLPPWTTCERAGAEARTTANAEEGGRQAIGGSASSSSSQAGARRRGFETLASRPRRRSARRCRVVLTARRAQGFSTAGSTVGTLSGRAAPHKEIGSLGATITARAQEGRL